MYETYVNLMWYLYLFLLTKGAYRRGDGLDAREQVTGTRWKRISCAVLCACMYNTLVRSISSGDGRWPGLPGNIGAVAIKYLLHARW